MNSPSNSPSGASRGVPPLMSAAATSTNPIISNLPKPHEEVWVENKTSDNRVYYYNARTRESAWTKPASGPNVRIITQDEVERMAAINNQLQHVAQTSAEPKKNGTDSQPKQVEEEQVNGSKQPPAAPAPLPVKLDNKPPKIEEVQMHKPPPSVPPPFGFPSGPPPFAAGLPPPPFMSGMFPPPTAGFPGAPPGFPPGMPPPPFGAPPFGAPFPIPPMPFAPPGIRPFPALRPTFEPHPLDEAKYFYTEETKREMKDVEEKLVRYREESAFFTEHDTPEGKKYYFNTKTNASTWDKPNCFVQITELEAKLEELKKRRVEKSIQEQKAGGGGGGQNNNKANNVQKDKENELSEEEKAKQKSKPISSTAVPGTPWCVVWTRDKRVFFFNPSEKVSLWERPPILIGRADVDRMVKECPVAGNNESTASPAAAVAANSSAKKKPGESGSGSASEQPPVKKNKIDDEEGSQSPRSDGSASPRTPSKVAPDEFLQKKEIEASKEAAIEAENKAAQVRAQLPLEQRIQQFRDLLTEKDVSAYSTWEKELQKIVFDPRYLLLTSKERKAVFEKYVRERADQESKEKSAALKKKREEFRELLKEVISNPKSAPSFVELSSKYGRDERFKGVEKTKDRESIYNDFLSDLRRQLDKQDEAKHDKKKNFYAMLKELKHLHRHSSWSETKKLIESDSRYKSIESSTKREDYFRDYCKTLDEKDFKEKDKDISRSNGVESSSSSSSSRKEKGDKERDRERDRDREKDKEKSSKKHGDGEKKEKESENNNNGRDQDEIEDGERMDTENDEEAQRKEREKQERIEASLRERSKEVKEQLSKFKSDAERERDQLKRDEAIDCFKALLIDLIKANTTADKASNGSSTATAAADGKSTTTTATSGDTKSGEQQQQQHHHHHHHKSNELTWKEAKKILKKDDRWSHCKLVEKEKKEKLFEEHMEKFRAKKRELFYQLLSDTPGIVLKQTTWKEVKKLIKTDPRYEKLSSNDSFKLEKEFETFMNDRYQKVRIDFKELLAQTKLITYKTFTTLKEQANHMKEIEDLLCNDKAYTNLDSVPDERKKILLDYIEQLHKEGPPPPPTATEPGRRK